MSEKRLVPPKVLNPELLYEKYKPLRLAVYSEFKDRLSKEIDREELMNHIDFSFIQLVKEYNFNCGVHFPYYIKKMLHLRTSHFITKTNNNASREIYAEEDPLIIDNSFNDIEERILEIHSINPNIVFGTKHRKLMVDILIKGKSLKDIADEEGITLERLHARLYFLRKKLKAEMGDVSKC